MVGRLASEYGRSFCTIPSAQEEYNERFNFRVQKRDKEYCHQPFLWDSGDESSNYESESKHYDEFKPVVRDTTVTGDNKVDNRQGQNVTSSYSCEERAVDTNDETELLGACDKNVPLADKCEVATQTKPATGRRRSASLKKFVPYALGSSSGCTGEKLTFNVKSDCDVYPSAIRADVRRKERLSSGKCDPNPVGLVSRNVPSDTNEANGPWQHSVNPTDSRPGQSSWHATPIEPPISDNTTNWISEYHQNYPVYPSSIYVRSASTAASRCRPFSASTTHQAASRTTQSIVPRTPVILSSRSSKSMVRKSVASEPCDVCYLRSVRNHYPVGSVNVL